MTRNEHLQWCKTRALEYVERNDLTNAFASMVFDLQKYKGTKDHHGIKLGMMLIMSDMLSASKEMHDFIEGFN